MRRGDSGDRGGHRAAAKSASVAVGVTGRRRSGSQLRRSAPSLGTSIHARQSLSAASQAAAACHIHRRRTQSGRQMPPPEGAYLARGVGTVPAAQAYDAPAGRECRLQQSIARRAAAGLDAASRCTTLVGRDIYHATRERSSAAGARAAASGGGERAAGHSRPPRRRRGSHAAATRLKVLHIAWEHVGAQRRRR